MSRRSKGPRLWLRPARRDKAGELTHEPAWFILDGTRQRSTGLGIGATEAQKSAALSEYLIEKHAVSSSTGTRDPSVIPIDDVLALYVRQKVLPTFKTVKPTARQIREAERAGLPRPEPENVQVSGHADPAKTANRIQFLKAFWSGKMLSEVTGATCRAYAAQRTSDAAALRELEDLRAAIKHHLREGLHDRIVSVVMPDKAPSRVRYLDRKEAAHIIYCAWRHRVPAGNGAERRPRRHVARFCVVSRYMGSRASVICSASLVDERPTKGAWVDTVNGIYYGSGAVERVTTKRKQTVRIPRGLLAHIRRWKANGQRFVVEWNGKPVASCKKAHAAAVSDAGLAGDVTQHTWRHTVATWLLQGGAAETDVADFLAIDVKTLRRVYGHHHPDHSAQVHAAFDRHRQWNAKDKSEQNAIPANNNAPEVAVKSGKRA